MDEDIKENSAPITEATTAGVGAESGQISGGPHDMGLDLMRLPAPPWTPSNLGEVFYHLALVCGAGNLRGQRNPSLDPRTFGRGRAARLISILPDGEARRAELMAEGERIQAIINQMLPAPAGSPRDPRAEPLRPSTTTRRSRRY